ncbi:DNA modification methylase [soil metagenome]
MLIESRPLPSIIPYARNPRENHRAVAAVARSITEFGFRQPIVVDAAGVIIAGHTRYKAALQLGLAEVPVHVATELTAAQIKAYRLADNKVAELSRWDMELLPLELAELKLEGIDLSLTGFNPNELAGLLGLDAQGALCDPDDVPGLPEAATTRPGDLWLLGEHRLLCGDSGSAADVDRLCAGHPIHLVNTDPPYNVKVEPRSNNAVAAGLTTFAPTSGNHHQRFDLARHPGKAKKTTERLRPKDRPLANDFVTPEEFARLLGGWFGNIGRVLVPGGGFYIWGGYANLANYPPALSAAELYFSQAIVWDKQHPVLTWKDFMGAFELAFYGWKVGAAHRYFGPTNATDLWPIKKVNPQSMVHLTEKPVELALRAINYSSLAGDHVLDLFGGSGSTLIACEQTGRRAHLMELDELYCDVIVQRYERFSGKKAVLEARP